MKTWKKYSKEFKLDAISLVMEQGYSRADFAAVSGQLNIWEQAKPSSSATFATVVISASFSTSAFNSSQQSGHQSASRS